MHFLRTRLFLVGITILSSGVIFLETKIAAGNTAEIQILRSSRSALEKEFGDLRRKNERASAEASAAKEQRARDEAKAAEAARAIESRLDPQARGWLEHFTTARRLLAKYPEFDIPELQKFEIRGWLAALKLTPFDTDENQRKSLAALRNAAKSAFMAQVSFAMGEYLKSHNGELPPDATALGSYLYYPGYAFILDRYKMALSGKAQERTNWSQPALLEKEPVDAEYDGRHGLTVGKMAPGSEWAASPGIFGGVGPAAWEDGAGIGK